MVVPLVAVVANWKVGPPKRSNIGGLQPDPAYAMLLDPRSADASTEASAMKKKKGASSSSSSLHQAEVVVM